MNINKANIEGQYENARYINGIGICGDGFGAMGFHRSGGRNARYGLTREGMMTAKANDIVLGLTRWILKIGTWLFLGLAGLMALIAIIAPIAVLTAMANDAIAAEGISADIPLPLLAGAVFALLALLCALLLLLWRFTSYLLAIVETVDINPFVQENAVRLRKMGWIAAACYPIGLAAAAVALWFERVGEAADADFDFGFDIGGLLLIFMLFILARVFEQGVAMREDLEGTV